jgi:hypothetical protein
MTKKHFKTHTRLSVQQAHSFAISMTCRNGLTVTEICGLRPIVTNQLFADADHPSLFKGVLHR